MAVPKRKVSKARRDKRRANTWTLGAPTIAACPQCKQPKLAHRVCKSCGYYDGRKAIELPDKDAKSKEA